MQVAYNIGRDRSIAFFMADAIRGLLAFRSTFHLHIFISKTFYFSIAVSSIFIVILSVVVLYFTSFSSAAGSCYSSSPLPNVHQQRAAKKEYTKEYPRYLDVTQKTFKCINIHFLLRCNGFECSSILPFSALKWRCVESSPKWLIVFMFAVLN